MVSTFTPNIQMEEPARGDDVGVWDTPVNNNSTLLDLIAGGIATISLNNANVTLSAAQFQSKTIIFNSTLTGSVTITFPTSFKKSYEIFHSCTGSSAFTITLATTAGGQVICPPPGENIDVWSDGTNIRFKNLGRVGEYWDYAGSSTPNWVSGCTVPPYLGCNGTAFSSATYPLLATILGGTTLPDQRGRTRYMLDGGANRVTAAVSGVNGNTFLAGGGDQATHAHQHAMFLTDPTHSHAFGAVVGGGTGIAGGPGNQIVGQNTNPAATGMVIGSAPGSGNNLTTVAFSGGSQNMPPVLIGGITLIRAA